MFHVGQKVVCIASFEEGEPQENDVNTVSGLEFNKIDYVTFKKYGDNWFWAACAFIPLSDWQEAEEAVKELIGDQVFAKFNKVCWELQKHLDQ